MTLHYYYYYHYCCYDDYYYYTHRERERARESERESLNAAIHVYYMFVIDGKYCCIILLHGPFIHTVPVSVSFLLP